jgi:hypothetical protein
MWRGELRLQSGRLSPKQNSARSESTYLLNNRQRQTFGTSASGMVAHIRIPKVVKAIRERDVHWEYLIESFNINAMPPDKIVEQLDSLGSVGWEVCAIWPTKAQVLLKRRTK